MSEKETAITRGNRVRYIRENILSLKRPEFCSNSFLNENTLKGWELAKHGGLTEKGARKLIERLEELNVVCNINWLLHGIGHPPHLVDPKKEDKSNEDTDQIAQELLVFRKQGKTLDTIIANDSMSPVYEKGDFIAGRITEPAKCNNKNCIILDNDNETHVGVLKQSENSEYYLVPINCHNQFSIKHIKIKHCAPIIWHRKPYS